MDHWDNSTMATVVMPHKNTTIDESLHANMNNIYDSETSSEMIRTFFTELYKESVGNNQSAIKPSKNLAKILQLRRQMEIQRIMSTSAGSFGILTTVFMLYIILHNIKLRTVNNMYYFTMFLSFFGMMLTRISYQLPLLISDVYSLSNDACNISVRILRFFYTSSLAFMSAIALNRMFAICFPAKTFLTGKELSHSLLLYFVIKHLFVIHSQEITFNHAESSNSPIKRIFALEDLKDGEETRSPPRSKNFHAVSFEKLGQITGYIPLGLASLSAQKKQ